MLRVVSELEHVELSRRSDPHDGQLEAVPLLEHLVCRVEHADVELDEALGVAREDCDMVDPLSSTRAVLQRRRLSVR
jgi:hypothetical protein